MTDTRTFVLDEDVKLGDNVIAAAGTTITVRKPDSGTLRDLQIAALVNLDVGQLLKLAPRLTSPMLAKGCRMSGADVTQFGMEVQDFLLPKAVQGSPAA